MDLKKLDSIYIEIKNQEKILNEKLKEKESNSTTFFDIAFILFVFIFVMCWGIAFLLSLLLDINYSIGLIFVSFLLSFSLVLALTRKGVKSFNKKFKNRLDEISVIEVKHDKLKVEFEKQLSENITQYFEEIKELDTNGELKELSEDFVTVVLDHKKDHIEKNYSLSDEINKIAEMEETAKKKVTITNN